MEPWSEENVFTLFNKQTDSTTLSLGYKIMLPFFKRIEPFLTGKDDIERDSKIVAETATLQIWT